jgi:hypothetical protein
VTEAEGDMNLEGYGADRVGPSLKHRLVVCSALLAATAASACGSSDATPRRTATTTTEAPGTAPPTATTSSPTLARLPPATPDTPSASDCASDYADPVLCNPHVYGGDNNDPPG